MKPETMSSKTTKLDIFTRLAIRAVMLFTAAILMTYVNDWLSTTGFFGDKPETRDMGCFVCDGIEWGARHYWYFWGCTTLFFLGLFRIINDVVNENIRP